jgi:short-subunit dehydrogenase
MTRTALITGASSGIGEAFAHVFAERGFDLVLTARREDRLRTLAASLAGTHGRRVEVIRADLAHPQGAATVWREVTDRGITVDALVNNAGFGVPGSYAGSEWARQAELLQVLVVALAELTHRCLPGMVARKYGRIINVASLAGLIPAPAGHTLYPASKALVVSFSQSLAEEVTRHGVYVTALCPGFTLSEFHDVTDTRRLMSRLPRFMWMDARTVAASGYDAVMAGRTNVIPGTVNRLIAAIGRQLPGAFEAFHRRFSWAYRRTD